MLTSMLAQAESCEDDEGVASLQWLKDQIDEKEAEIGLVLVHAFDFRDRWLS